MKAGPAPSGREGGEPFEPAAYDSTFSDTVLGRLYRDAVWARFDRCFPPGSRVLEVNCGTGVDAAELTRRGVRVLATDASAAMVARTRARGVEARVCPIEDIGSLAGAEGPFDGVLSNFGGLNCVADLGGVARDLAGLVRPGGVMLWCIMGPVVPWEIAWFLAHGHPRTAVRRLRPAVGGGPLTWRGVALRYPSVEKTIRAAAPWFTARATGAVGLLLPPPYTERWAARHPAWLRRLDRVERRVEGWPGAAQLADHYVVELVRTPDR